MTKDFLNIRSGLKILPFCFAVMLSPTLVSANECVDQHEAQAQAQAMAQACKNSRYEMCE